MNNLQRKYNPYPAYKSTEKSWFERIPENWGKLKLKFLTECLDGRRIPLNGEERSKMQGNYPYWGANCIVDFVDDYLFDEELILLGEDGAPFFDKYREKAFHISGRVWVNNHAHVLRPNAIDAKFLTYVLNSVDYGLYIKGTTRDKLNQADMKVIEIILPSEIEQQGITQLLHRETFRINSTIEKERQLIELLKEKRAALITNAVTKGLDPDVKMKNSGVEWVGEIPEGWEIDKLCRRAKIVGRIGWKGYTVGDLVSESKDGVLVLGATQINRDNKIDLSEKTYLSFEKYEESPEIKLYGNEILVVKVGATIGKVAIIPQDLGKATINPNVMIVKMFRGINHAYLYYFFNTKIFQNQLNLEKEAGAQDAINQTFLKSLFIPIPSDNEQNEIIKMLETETSRIDLLVNKIEVKVRLLEEYKQSLITAAVTGKIDVRNYGTSNP